MILEAHATFRFIFRDITSKNESLIRLRKLLHDKDWLPDDSDYDSSLLEYHTDNNGFCDVAMKSFEGNSVEDLADIFFADLCNTKDVKCVKVLYNSHTDKLVQNNSGKYHCIQTVDLLELKDNDEVIILYRK